MVFKQNNIPWNKGTNGIMKAWNKGLTKELDSRVEKYGKSLLGKKFSKKRCLNISIGHKGQIPWSTGLTKETDERIMRSSKKMLGDKNPMKRPEVRKKVSDTSKGKHFSPKTEFKKGQFALDKHFNWKGGKSFEHYSIEFTEKLKEGIRRIYFYRCQQCFRHQNESRRKLDIHHIDFNKNNNKEENLIPLCNSCHSQTNYNRNNMIDYFITKVKYNHPESASIISQNIANL